MKTLKIALLGSALIFSGGALAGAPEGNGNVTTASYAAPQGNGAVTTASYAAPQGNGAVTTASYAAPQGHHHVVTAGSDNFFRPAFA